MDNLISQIKSFEDNLKSLEIEKISDYNLEKTALFIIDMNNGFAKEGALYSPRVENLIEPIAKFSKDISKDIKKIIAFTDCHEKSSIEFSSFPSHCLRDDVESEIVEELKEIANLEVVPKNSTNGFFALNNFNFDEIDNFIVVGDCTDICIYQFCITLKAYFNQNNLDKKVVVPMDLVDTYDIENVHPADLLNTIFLNSMIQNGITVVKKIEI